MPRFTWHSAPELLAGPCLGRLTFAHHPCKLAGDVSISDRSRGWLTTISGNWSWWRGVALCSWRVLGLSALVCARMSQGRLSAWQQWLPPAHILGSRGGGGGGGHSGLEDTVGLDRGDDNLLQLLQSVS